ncbi:MAG TPA: beta-ketoacyl-ACP synthase III [Steroidobacteraceae bacterium]|nr:beta-ketoacyl-ACP synthase III [Steroidobacteraceae bacterium]
MTGRAVYITNTSSFLPNAPVGNDQMERILGQLGDRPSRARRTVLRSNGIESRHYAIDPQTLKPTHNNASLTAAAVRGLADEHFNLEALECLACGTSIADQLMPSHASMVHGELKLPPLEAVATTGVCLSGLAAINYAYMSVASGSRNNAVATGSELSSAVLCERNLRTETEVHPGQLEGNPELAFDRDFLRWMLSDGSGALLLEPAPRSDRLNLRIDWIDLFSYAGSMETCMYAGAVKGEDGRITGWAQYPPHERETKLLLAVRQDVKLLNEHVMYYTVEKPLVSLIPKRKLIAQDIDYFLPHYSSKYFRDKVYTHMQRAGLDVPQDRWFTNLPYKGNIGAAAIYIIIDELVRSGKLKRGHRLLCYVPESGRFATGFMHLTVV